MLGFRMNIITFSKLKSLPHFYFENVSVIVISRIVIITSNIKK